MCRAHAGVRHLVSGLLAEEDVVAVVDLEPGLEYLSRGTEREVDTLLVVLEPYYKALETGRRAAELGSELGIERVVAVANKLRDPADRAAVVEFAARYELPVVAEIPYDDRVRQADLLGVAPIDSPRTGEAVEAIQELAETLGL